MEKEVKEYKVQGYVDFFGTQLTFYFEFGSESLLKFPILMPNSLVKEIENYFYEIYKKNILLVLDELAPNWKEFKSEIENVQRP